MRFEFVPPEMYADRVIEARGLRHAEFPRRYEWGPSDSVLEAQEPAPSGAGSRLVITMQSGDDLVVVADEFVLDPE